MIKKLFSKENQTVQTDSNKEGQTITSDQQIEFEQTLNKLNIQIETIDKASEKIEDKLEQIDLAIHKLVQEKKKNKAHAKIREAQGYKKQLENFERQKNVLFSMKIRLETAQQSTINAEFFIDVNKLLQEQKQVNEQMEKEIQDYQDFLMAEQEQVQMWKQFEDMETKDMDLDGELERIEAEMEMQQSLNKNNIINKMPSLSTQSNSLSNSQQKNDINKSIEKLLI